MHTPAAVLDGTASLAGHYEPSRMLRLAIVLTPPHPVEEDEFLEALQDKQSPLFHRFLSPEEWNARFSPTAEDEQAVVDWAASQGLTITRRYPNRLLVDVEAAAGVIENALHVTINSYRLPAEEGQAEGRIVFSNDRDPVLPSRLSGVVETVEGLDSIERMEPASRNGADVPQQDQQDYVPGPAIEELDGLETDARPESEASGIDGMAGPRPEVTAPNSNYWTPAFVYSSQVYDYQALMNLGHCCNPLNAPSQSPRESSIAIAAFGDVQPVDISGFVQEFNLASNVFRYAVDGRYTCANTSTSLDNNCIEAALDTEWALTTANSVSTAASTSALYVYEGSTTTGNPIVVDVYNAIANANQARVMSTSWGCPEDPNSGTNGCTADTMRPRDDIFKSMVGQGWTIVAASGDAGATANCDNNLHVGFPASSPYVIAVGGTSLNEGTVSSNYEVAWTGSTASGSCKKNNGGSTGGFSEYWPVPSSQGYLGFAKRAVPDIALDAAHFHDVYVSGGWSYNGGTSVAGPMIAGFFAQENAYLLSLGNLCGAAGTSPCAPLGDPHAELYDEVRANDGDHNPFYDIVSGCNSNDITALYGLAPFCAGPGYDEVTGLGSANMLQLAWAINWRIAAASGRPNVTFTGPKTNKWYNTNQIVKFEINDDAGGKPGIQGTGIAGFSQAWDRVPNDPASEPHGGTGNLFYSGPEFPNTTTGCLSITGAGGCEGQLSQGCHTAYVHGWNNQGETTAGTESYGPVCYDTVPPTVTALTGPKPNPQGWNNKPVTVVFGASDPGGAAASGIKHIYYGVNDQCVTTNLKSCAVYGGTLKFDRDGIYTIVYFAEDNAGNIGANTFDYIRVMLDQTPPVTTAKIAGTLSGGVYVSTVNLTMQVTDNLSDALYTEYQIDGAPAQYYDTGSTPLNLIPVTGLGKHTFKYWSIDLAGNQETAHTLTFSIAKGTATTLTVSPNPALFGQTVLIKAKVTDPLSGTTPTGTIKFLNGTTVLAWLTLGADGTAAITDGSFAAGSSNALTAVYQGATGFPASTSAVVTEVVQSKEQSVTALKSSANPSTSGKPVTFTAQVTPSVSGIPTGSVIFKDGSIVIGSGTLGASEPATATFTTSALASGTHSISAFYDGSTTYAPSASATLSQKVN